jgi:hypothetical protein
MYTEVDLKREEYIASAVGTFTVWHDNTPLVTGSGAGHDPFIGETILQIPRSFS